MTAQSFHKLKVAFNNAFRMMHNLPTYCSASEIFTVNRVADCKAVIRNLVHCFMMRGGAVAEWVRELALKGDRTFPAGFNSHCGRL